MCQKYYENYLNIRKTNQCIRKTVNDMMNNLNIRTTPIYHTRCIMIWWIISVFKPHTNHSNILYMIWWMIWIFKPHQSIKHFLNEMNNLGIWTGTIALGRSRTHSTTSYVHTYNIFKFVFKERSRMINMVNKHAQQMMDLIYR